MPKSSAAPNRLKWKLVLFLGSALASALTVFLVWRAHPDLAYWQSQGLAVREFLDQHPWTLIFLLATLPGLGFPLSPLLILFGILLAPRFGMPLTCLIGVTALAFCTVWTYALSAGPLRNFLRHRLLKKFTLPELKGKNGFRIALIIRITPGIPYPLQNFSLGVMGLDFKSYCLASIPIQSLYAIAFMVTGGALFEGQFGLAITGVILLIVLVLAARIYSQRRKIDVG